MFNHSKHMGGVRMAARIVARRNDLSRAQRKALVAFQRDEDFAADAIMTAEAAGESFPEASEDPKDGSRFRAWLEAIAAFLERILPLLVEILPKLFPAAAIGALEAAEIGVFHGDEACETAVRAFPLAPGLTLLVDG